MQISREVCGFSGGESDTLRKAIGKKIRETMRKMESRFIEGGVEHSGVPKDIMEAFWHDILGFADYAFNKSHSVCYGLIAYQTAYLKAHYPAAFMAALMTSDANNIDRLSIEIAECQSQGIEVLQPDVNESYHEFSVVNAKEKIRFGLDAVKNVGHGAVAEIIRARDEDGEFIDINDFIKRVNSRIVNRKTWESLIKAGAFDRFENRGTLLASLDDIIYMAQKFQKEQLSGQTDIFGDLAEDDKDNFTSQIRVKLTSKTDPDMPEILAWERELLGLYLSEHPLKDFKEYLEQESVPVSSITITNDGSIVSIGGLVQDVRSIITKKGQPMAFVRLEDLEAEIEIVVFPGLMDSVKDFLVQDKVLLVTGKVQSTDQSGVTQDTPKILAENIIEVTKEVAANSLAKNGVKETDSYQENSSSAPTEAPTALKSSATAKQALNEVRPQRLYIRLDSSDDGELLKQIKTNLDSHPGDTEAVFVIGSESDKKVLRLPQRVDASQALIDKLVMALGEDSIKLS